MVYLVAGLSLICGAAAGAAPLEATFAPSGWLELKSGGRTILHGGLMCYGQAWDSCGQEHATDVSRPEPNRFVGRMAMPASGKGHLCFEQSAAWNGLELQIDYAVEFEAENEIHLQSVLFYLPAEVFAGRQATFYPAGSEVGLSSGSGAFKTECFGWAVSFAMDADRVLLIQTTGGTLIELSDTGQPKSKTYALAFRMVGDVKVPAGAATRRRIRFSVVTPEEARRSARLQPQFDRTRASLLLDVNGRVWLRDRQRDYASVSLAVQGPHWTFTGQDEMVGWSEIADDRRTLTGTMPIHMPVGQPLGAIQFKQATERTSEGLRLGYETRFLRSERINGYYVAWSIRAAEFVGHRIELTGPAAPTSGGSATSRNTLTVPPQRPAKSEVGTYTVTRVAFAPDHPLGFVLSLDRPMPLRIEDRRAEDAELYELQFLFARGDKGVEITGGTSAGVSFDLRPNSGHQVVLDDMASAHRTDTLEWIRYTPPWDTCAVDLSFLNGSPAGQHGFLGVRGERFVFADGTPARFWGTNFSAEQNLPPHCDAEATARRLARYGVNMVRIHQADAGYATNNLFRRERRTKGTRQLDPESMDRLDYLVAQLRQQGIYVYFDLLSTRTFDLSDGVVEAGRLELGGKPYANFDGHLIRLQEEFATSLLTHRNPYTALTYANDPAVAMIAIANENDVFSGRIEIEPYRTRFELLYRAWAIARGVSLPAGRIDLDDLTPSLLRFMVDVQRAYHARMVSHLRRLGVRVPITGSNWTVNAPLVASFGPCDFTDSHGYWDHCWDRYTRIRNRMMVRSRPTIFGSLAFQRVPGKPFFCSEYGQPWPNEFRAEMPLAVAAVASFQDWGGALIYTYAHRSDPTVDCLSGPFETLNDPCLFGLFPHAALMVRRGDVQTARERLAIRIPDQKVYDRKPAAPSRCVAYDVSAERSIVATALGPSVPKGWREVPSSQPVVAEAAHEVFSDTGEFRRDWKAAVATVDTPRTQAAWGFLGEPVRPIRLGDVEMALRSPFAVVAVSSLTDEPIGSSGRLLITTVARAENTGMVYDLFHTRKISPGHAPILIEPVCGSLSIRTSRAAMRVRGLDPQGATTVEMDCPIEEGRLRLDVGPRFRTMYYLLEAR